MAYRPLWSPVEHHPCRCNFLDLVRGDAPQHLSKCLDPLDAPHRQMRVVGRIGPRPDPLVPPCVSTAWRDGWVIPKDAPRDGPR